MRTTVLEKIIVKRFNEKTIDKIAECGSSNKCEGFWSQLVKLSEGKRIAGCGTDLWNRPVVFNVAACLLSIV